MLELAEHLSQHAKWNTVQDFPHADRELGTPRRIQVQSE